MWTRRRAEASEAVQRSLERSDRAVDVFQLVEPEQAQSERLEAGWFVALQRHAGGNLQALRGKGLPVLQAVIVRVADDDSGCVKAVRSHAAESAPRERVADFPAKVELGCAKCRES